jgi:hypothetical protein
VKSKSVAAIIIAMSVSSLAAQNNQAVFDERIRPVLQKNCASCHTGAGASGGLNVATFDTLLTGGKHGTAIVPVMQSNPCSCNMCAGSSVRKCPWAAR